MGNESLDSVIATDVSKGCLDLVQPKYLSLYLEVLFFFKCEPVVAESYLGV